MRPFKITVVYNTVFLGTGKEMFQVMPRIYQDVVEARNKYEAEKIAWEQHPEARHIKVS